MKTGSLRARVILTTLAVSLVLLARMTTTPSYVTHYLPAIALTALGVSLCLPQLSSAAVQGLPPDRFGSGAAVCSAAFAASGIEASIGSSRSRVVRSSSG